MEHLKRRFVIFCFGAGLTLLAAGLVPFIAGGPYTSAQEAATPEATVEAALEVLVEATAEAAPADAAQPAANNGYCTVCHNQPWRAVTLQDGYVLNLYIDPDIIANSVHGFDNPDGPMGCLDCHTEEAFPHDGPTPTNARAYAITTVEMCNGCHEQEAVELEAGLHEKAIEQGNLDAAVCTDCHGSHDIQPSTNRPQLVAGVCGDCHKSTYDEWRNSPHVEVGPLGCAKCHSPHSQELRVGDVNELCTNCHKAPGDIYIHEQHIGSTASDVTCADCHMYQGSDIQMVSVEFKPTGHSMALDARPCNSCHEQLQASGQWEEIANTVNERILSERDELQTRVTELENAIITAEEQSSTGSIQLTQGLIIGLGLGITLAVVLIPRFNRVNRRKENSQEENGHE